MSDTGATVGLPDFAAAIDYSCVGNNKTPARILASRGSAVRSSTSLPGIKAGLNLGLRAWSPMPRGRQLAHARRSHVLQHPPLSVSGSAAAPATGRHPGGRRVDDTLHLSL